MENITIDSFKSQLDAEEEEVCAPLVGRGPRGRSFKDETDQNSAEEEKSAGLGKSKSCFRARFGSKAHSHDKTDLLDRGIRARPVTEESKESESFKESIDKVNSALSLKDKDKQLAELFNPIINPGKFPDGHCAKCAFNTHLHFIGRKLQEAEAVNTETFVKFSHWFYVNFSPDIVDCVETVRGKKNETFEDFKHRVAERILANTISGEAVLLSICEGAHWLNGYNDGERVWFVDSQTAKGFNVYSDDNESYDPDIDLVNIVKVTSAQISEYDLL